ncbi:hypothetical protein ECL_00148 [Enterobacter cloacae subsp. cloacae ATCC 13047]|uniref:Uncharacterized protein n=1 Tax=Enterobacter cloacae subsp. cloacae (strain ATCC 13047 / DSM 30054 / NBRC 13535 / NCTC 10005 / WDCM 00083 / NCDC 279-56) TaxID=716541 RepID=A0A0H3CEZ9_ENTCC|nr:hypothetical protein ECL_00148 [Enterobacter cloacae subsp. cloacae ATCC 13047]
MTISSAIFKRGGITSRNNLSELKVNKQTVILNIFPLTQ